MHDYAAMLAFIDLWQRSRNNCCLAAATTGLGLPLTTAGWCLTNPYLSMFFNCHINVEVCTSAAVVKYFYKYVYKGRDRAQVDVAAPDGAAPA